MFYGDIPHWKDGKGWPNFENIDRWWGCEVHFDPSIDRAFQVKNIKRGAVPMRELKIAIKQKIRDTRDTVLHRIRDLWAANKIKQRSETELAEGEKLLKRAGQHSLA